jgi:hypothetical protein
MKDFSNSPLTLLIVAFSLVLSGNAFSQGKTFTIEPGDASRITQAIAAASAGDTIRLLPGTYEGTVFISNSGSRDRPIVITGPAEGEARALLDALGTPGNRETNHAFVIEDASWIEIKNLDVINSWTDVIVIRNSSYISIRGCNFIKTGKTVVAPHGPRSHHILIENCFWSQDERIYTEWDWDSLHHGELVHFNGGLYGGTDSAGGSVIRFNHVEDVFDGIRWWMNQEAVDQFRFQSNIEIYDNSFVRVRDNIIEPERFTWNLHVYHNRLDTSTAPVSIDGIRGGEIFFYGNTGYRDASIPRGTKDGVPQTSPSWTTIKFHDYVRKPNLDYPLYLFNNSWHYDRTFARGGRMRKANDHVFHFNNALLHQNSDIGAIYDWPGLNSEFDYDISSAPWPDGVIRDGHQLNGIPATDPRFKDSVGGDFRLHPDSKAIDAGKILEGFTLWYLGASPNMGAYEGEQRVYGLPFHYREAPGGSLYQEKPRIVRIFHRGDRLAIFFSTEMDPASLEDTTFALESNHQKIPVKSLAVAGAPRQQALIVTLEGPLPEEMEAVQVYLGNAPLRGLNGKLATLWAADLRLVRIPGEATLTSLLEGLFL